MERSANVATPPTAASALVPESVPPPGFAPIATVTVPLKVGSVLPSASSAVTWTAGVIAAPAGTALGCTVKTNCVAAPAATVNGLLATPAKPVAVAASVQPVPALLTL